MASSANGELKAFETIFSWIVGGGTLSTLNEEAVCRRTRICKRLWKMDQIPGDEEQLTSDDQKTLDQIRSTTTRGEDGRMVVQLPRKATAPELGESHPIAEQRFQQNERSLHRKGKLERVRGKLRDYAERDHSKKVLIEDLAKPVAKHFYLPMHCVEKVKSTTMKLRIVSDASAKTSTEYRSMTLSLLDRLSTQNSPQF